MRGLNKALGGDAANAEGGLNPVRQSQKSPYTPAFVGGVLFFLASVALVLWFSSKVAGWVQHQQTAPIKQVRLYGDFGHIEPARLHSTLQQHLVGNFFKVDVDEVATFLRQQPWVNQVAVRKQWPGVLVVVVTEHSPVAVWNQEYLLNTKGEVFRAPLDQVQTQLPKLNGPEGAEQDALSMYAKVQALLALHQFEAAGLTLSARQAWQLNLAEGIKLTLGREDTAKRVQRFIDLYPVISKHKTQAVAEVDLRYDTGVAVRWVEAPEQREQDDKVDRT